jgi:hypothetical protein
VSDAETRPVEQTKDWLTWTASVDKAETAYLDHQLTGDLMNIGSLSMRQSRLDTSLERSLKWLHRNYRKVSAVSNQASPVIIHHGF